MKFPYSAVQVTILAALLVLFLFITKFFVIIISWIAFLVIIGYTNEIRDELAEFKSRDWYKVMARNFVTISTKDLGSKDFSIELKFNKYISEDLVGSSNEFKFQDHDDLKSKISTMSFIDARIIRHCILKLSLPELLSVIIQKFDEKTDRFARKRLISKLNNQAMWHDRAMRRTIIDTMRNYNPMLFKGILKKIKPEEALQK